MKRTQIASGDFHLFYFAIDYSIESQKELLLSTDGQTDETLTWRDGSSKNFTDAVLSLSSLLLENEAAYWGLNTKNRNSVVDNLQDVIDQTLHLLAQNLIDKKYVIDYETIGIEYYVV